jgi:hypothetical protein
LPLSLRQVAWHRQRQVLKRFSAAGAGPLPPVLQVS